ncbi:CU044_5270 family protein [Streptomyces sp. NPDC088354]|uniref:CU044_5270 family protein n=1 Tax=unclassified Streptomyces TaxID=2593676 RepID=UPI0029B1DEF4|nr:CU044_5270 family protein [Streptomyces sp. MI02-7b]MDX3073393.1 CU044_5270 family protein [Streptomyces sp. MI02-7b]
MKANQSRQSPAEWEESASLLPQTGRDLPTGRHQFHKERLMAHIQQDRQRGAHMATAGSDLPKNRGFRMPRLAIALPVAALAVAGAVVAGTALNGGPGGQFADVATGPALTTQVSPASAKGLNQLIDQISLAASAEPRPVMKPGQYVYIESQSADTFVKSTDDKSSLASHALHKRQIWRSADGTKGWLIDPAVNRSPEGETLSLPDEQGHPFKASLNGPSYEFLATLPTDPDELLKMIYKAAKGHGNSLDQQAFTTIGDLLGESYPPAELYSALFRTAAKIPGVVVVDDAQDAIGRTGVAVARLDETSGERQEWIFDKKTHVFLGERTVQVREVPEDGVTIKPGTVLYTDAITDRAIVDGMKQTPGQKA